MNDICQACEHRIPKDPENYEYIDKCGLTGGNIMGSLPKDCPLDENEIRRLEIRLGWLYREVHGKIKAIKHIKHRIHELNKAYNYR